MDSHTINTWWGKFTWDELKKFMMLSGIFMFTIGTYWLLRPIKDTVFNAYVGAVMIPYAKFLSFGVVIPLVFLYIKLVDAFPRHRVFYALSTIYALIAFGLAIAMMHPALGIHAVVKGVGHPLVLGRMIGWATYVFVESFGSIMVALFWAFASDTTTPDSAKRGYALIALGAQLGNILGPLLVVTQAERLGVPPLLMIAAVALICIGGMIWIFMQVIPEEQLRGYQAEGAHDKPTKKKKTSFADGIRLLLSEPYLLSIFGVITLYEIINTIFDFHLKYLASLQYSDPNVYLAYMGKFGLYTGIVSCGSVFLGVNNIGRKLGLSVALVVLPVLVAIATLVLASTPTLEIAFWIMVIIKGLNYALNQPSKEQLYIPTKQETKYKVKAFIEMFGSRGSKATGSVINAFKRFITPEGFLMISTIASLGMIGVWIYAALFLARTHKRAVSKNEVVC